MAAFVWDIPKLSKWYNEETIEEKEVVYLRKNNSIFTS